jgi:hypothetical protein
MLSRPHTHLYINIPCTHPRPSPPSHLTLVLDEQGRPRGDRAMDLAGEIQRVVSMRRDSGGSVWRSRNNVFSRSSREADHVDDEEALRWAALEKLPTRDRVRRAILVPPAGDAAAGAQGVVDVDVLSLGPGERRALLERLVRVADEDHERFLIKLRERLERYYTPDEWLALMHVPYGGLVA